MAIKRWSSRIFVVLAVVGFAALSQTLVFKPSSAPLAAQLKDSTTTADTSSTARQTNIQPIHQAADAPARDSQLATIMHHHNCQDVNCLVSVDVDKHGQLDGAFVLGPCGGSDASTVSLVVSQRYDTVSGVGPPRSGAVDVYCAATRTIEPIADDPSAALVAGRQVFKPELPWRLIARSGLHAARRAVLRVATETSSLAATLLFALGADAAYAARPLLAHITEADLRVPGAGGKGAVV
eukprot:SAG11_NODE_9441_length_911_cov_1.076355_1_plen_237_part_10